MQTSIRLVLMGMLGLVAMGDQTLAQEPRTTWTLGAGLRESNQFSRVVNDEAREDQILDNANLRLQLSTRTERSEVGLFGRLGANVYREGPSRPERINYGGGLSWAFTPSSRVGSNVNVAVSRNFQAETLSDLAVLTPDVETTSTRASWGLRVRTSPRTTVATSLSYSHVEFEMEEAITGSQLVLNTSPFDEVFPDVSEDTAGDGEFSVPDAEDAVLQILATEGVTFRDSTSRWATATFGVSRRLTERTSFGFNLAGGYRTIDSSAFELREGAEAGARVWARRVVGAASALQTSYTFRRSLALEPETTIQSLMGGVSYSPRGRSLNLSLQGGASYFQAEGVESLLTPTVDASLATSLTRTTHLGVAYRRQFQQSLGFGQTLLIDFANVTLTQQFGSRVDVTALAGASLGTDPLVEDSSFDAFRMGGTVTVRILEPLSAGTSLFVLETQRSTETSETETSRNLWTLFLNFSKSWN